MENSSPKKPLSVFMINYDWRDIFRNSFIELHEKLERDQLGPDYNEFFFFSYANVSYEKMDGRYKTVHRKTRLYKLKPLLDILTVFRLISVAKQYSLKPDVWTTYDFGMLPALWLGSRLFGGKVVLIVSNQPRVYSQTRRFGAIKGFYSWLTERLWWRLADHFFTINQNMREYLEKVGIPKAMISVFYVNTIDRDLKYIEQSNKGLIRRKYSIDSNKNIVMTVARLEAEKNYPELLKLFAELGPDYILFILGQGSLLPALQQQVKDLGIADRVKFIGYVHRNEIWNYYRDADVFILLSKAEALGLVFWEAMHVGVLVIGSTADGIVETIGADKDRGRIWQTADGSAGFRERVNFCITKSPERDAMIERAKKFVDQQRKNSLTFNDLSIFRK